MGFLPNGTWVIDTLGDLIEAGGSLTAYCSNRLECGRALELDVYDLALQFGRRAKLVGGRFPLKCARCGSKEVHFIRAPDTRIGEAARATPDNFRSTRPQEEREALMLIFPPRREWPARGDR